MKTARRRNYPSPVLLPSERRQWSNRLQDELAIVLTRAEKTRLTQYLTRFEAEVRYRTLKQAR